MNAVAGTPFLLETDDWPTGLTGVIGYVIVRASDGAVTQARTTAGVTELAALPGSYVAFPTIAAAGTYLARWDDGTGTTSESEEIDVTASIPAPAMPASAYAGVADLKRVVGRLQRMWSATSLPKDPDDLTAFLLQAAARINGALSSRAAAFPLDPALEPAATAALAGLNAKMAAIDALAASFPSNSGPQEAAELLDELREQVYGARGDGGEWGALLDGTHPAVLILVQEGAVPEATSFWDREPDYGESTVPAETLLRNPQMLPFFSRLSGF